MGDSESDFAVGDLDILRDIGADKNSGIWNLRTAMKLQSHQDLTVEKLSEPGISTDTLAKILFEGY